jgi:hypothetical protein
MLTPADETFIRKNAYLPEHIPGYGSVMSGGEPFLIADFLVYLGQESLVFIGFPLEGGADEKRLTTALDEALQRFKPARVSWMAPIPLPRTGTRGKTDFYYRLDLAHIQIRSKVKNMIHRAERVLRVEKGKTLGDAHRRLIGDFLNSPELEEGTRTVFTRIPGYISSVPSSEVFSAYDSSGRLAAFDVAEYGAEEYVFHMFNFRSRSLSLPGASDLLLYAIIEEAKAQGKKAANLGLGINPGVAFFKEKWGARPFLNHEALAFPVKKPSLFAAIFQGLGRG